MRPVILSCKSILATVSFLTTLLVCVAQANAQTNPKGALLFDNITSTGTGDPVSLKFTTATPRSMFGTKINFAAGNAPVQISQMRLGLAHLATVATQYTGIQLQMKFYDDGSTVDGTKVFTNAASDVLTFNVFDSIKANTPAIQNNTLLPQRPYFLDVDMPSTLRLADPYNIGIAFRFLGDKGDGLGFQASNDLSFVLRSGGPFFAGSSDFPNASKGYFRDGGDGLPPTNDFNFDQEDAQTLGNSPSDLFPNVGVAMQVYAVPVAVVPENNTGVLLLTGVAVLGGTAVVRRRAVKL